MPIHIDPSFAATGGHKKGAILHGAGFMGIAGCEIWRRYGAFRSMRVRFVGTVVPGERLRVEMWEEFLKEGRKAGEEKEKVVVFEVVVVESGRKCIAGGGVRLGNRRVERERGVARL